MGGGAVRYDRHRGTDLVEPVARSVLAAHTEARHRVLMILATSSGMPAEEAMRLDQLRRRSERWTDVLLGQMAAQGDVGQFAFDPERAADFAEDLAAHAPGEGRCQVWPLMMSSMRASFRHGLCAVSPNADLNATIAASIVSFFPPELFDAAGVPESLWLIRMAQTDQRRRGADRPVAALRELRARRTVRIGNTPTGARGAAGAVKDPGGFLPSGKDYEVRTVKPISAPTAAA